MIKSPFLIFKGDDSISPFECEKIVDSVDFVDLDRDKLTRPIETHKFSNVATEIHKGFIEQHREMIETYYGRKIVQSDQSRVMWSDPRVVHRTPWCDNSIRSHDKWLRVHSRDLTVLTFCVDYNDKPPFDDDFEVYGGKIEFPSHNFGFNPIRGVTIIYPSDPHFAHVFSQVMHGNLFVCKTFLTTDPPLIYSPKNFPGTWKEWLQEDF